MASTITIEEAVSDLKWQWLLFDKFFRILEMNLFIAVLFYFYYQTDSFILWLSATNCLMVYGLFALELICYVIKVVNVQADIGKTKKNLYKILFTIVILFFVGLFLSTALLLAGQS